MNEILKAALLKLGVSSEQSAFYAEYIKVEENADIEQLAIKIKGIIPESIDSSEIDRRISKGLETGNINYLKKLIEEGKVIEKTEEPVLPKGEEKTEIQELIELVKLQGTQIEDLKNTNTVKSLTEKANELITFYKVPDHLKGLFIVNEKTDITAFESQIKTVMAAQNEQIKASVQNDNQPFFSGNNTTPKAGELTAKEKASSELRK